MITTEGGNDIRNVIVTLSGCGLSQPISVQTELFGSYSFSGLTTGQNCTIMVSANRFTFTLNSQTITLNGNTTVNFVANPGFGVRKNEHSKY